jgi:hypothetical protein
MYTETCSESSIWQEVLNAGFSKGTGMRTRMTKSLTFNRQRFAELLYCALCIFLIILLSVCGDAIYSTSEAGSIAFSVEWKDAPTLQASQASIKAASLDCEAAGVSTVEGKVYDENNTFLARNVFL